MGVEGTCAGILLDVLLQRQVPGKTLLPCMLNPTFIVWHLRKGESHWFYLFAKTSFTLFTSFFVVLGVDGSIFLPKLHLIYLLHFWLPLEFFFFFSKLLSSLESIDECVGSYNFRLWPPSQETIKLVHLTKDQ